MANKQANRTLFHDKQPTDNVTFGGVTYRIDVDRLDGDTNHDGRAITENTVRLAPTDRGGKLTGAFETFDLI